MARRKKSSPLEAVLDSLAMLPWWVCLVLAALSYPLLHRLASPIQVSDIQSQGGALVGTMVQKAILHGIANAAQYIAPLLLLVAAALSAWRRKQRQTLVADVAQARNSHALHDMSWREFELLVGEAYRLQGYRVDETGGGGPDGGVDLVLTKGSEKFFVQCKQWKAYKVGVATVRELYGVMAARGGTGGFVITSGRFTTDAKDFAEGRNIELVDGLQLFAMVQQGKSAQGQPVAAQRDAPSSTECIVPKTGTAAQNSMTQATAAAQPECPRCGAAMALRTARQGENVGNRFWGCSTFPKCRGTVTAS